MPVFQPIVDVVQGGTAGYEALSRFTDPEGPTSPEEWFTAAVLAGYAGKLEALVLSETLQRRETLPGGTFMSVNVSPHAFTAPEVLEVLDHYEDLSRVIFEITEQAPVEDYDRLVAQLNRLRDRGAMIGVDDTGAGYASLSHLLALHPEFVKLDRKLITDLHEDPHRAAAVSALGAFATAFDAWLIAEGVERYEELERLIELGVPLVQGYLLGRPGPEMEPLGIEISRWLRERSVTRRNGQLASLAQPAVTVRNPPDVVSGVTVLVDDHQRPQQVFVPGDRGRASRHPAIAVLPHDELRSVARRVAARGEADRYAPVCLCDDMARLTGVIHVSSLLEALARE